MIVMGAEDTLVAHEQRRLAAIVAIDVVGYSRLMGRNESGTHALLKTHLAERVMPSLRRHGGRLVKSTGDGVLAEFGSTVDALSALIELQQGDGQRKPRYSPRPIESYSAPGSILAKSSSRTTISTETL